MAHFLFAKESGYTPSGAEIYFVNSDPAGDAGNSLQEWPSWVLACSFSCHSCFLCLWCGRMFLNASKPPVEKLLPLPVGTAFPQMCQKSSTLTCVLSNWLQTKPAQLSWQEHHGTFCADQGARDNPVPVAELSVPLQKGCGLTAIWDIKHFHPAKNGDKFAGPGWNVAMICSRLLFWGWKGVRVAAEWSIRCHLPEISSPWAKPGRNWEAFSPLLLYPLPNSSQFCLYYTSWLLIDLLTLPTLNSYTEACREPSS